MILPFQQIEEQWEEVQNMTLYGYLHTQMRDIVTIRKSGCDKDILFSVLR